MTELTPGKHDWSISAAALSDLRSAAYEMSQLVDDTGTQWKINRAVPVSRYKEIARYADNITHQLPVPPTAQGVANLHLFNFICSHPNFTDREFHSQLEFIHGLSIIEENFARPEVPLPTIGFETEIPTAYIPHLIEGDSYFDDILNQLRIHHLNFPGYGHLYEVNPRCSYSPQVQQVLLRELTTSLGIPIIPSNPFKGMDKDAVISFHINAGAPAHLRRLAAPTNRDYFSALIFLIGSTPVRILERKSSELDNLKEDDVERTAKNVPSFSAPVRWELKGPELRNAYSLSLLPQIQDTTACYFAFWKRNQGLAVTQEEDQLARLWFSSDGTPNLIADTHNLFTDPRHRKYFRGLPFDYVLENYNYRENMVNLIKNTHIQEMGREILLSYAQQARQIVFENHGVWAQF